MSTALSPMQLCGMFLRGKRLCARRRRDLAAGAGPRFGFTAPYTFRPNIEGFDEAGKCHRKVNVVARNMKAKPISHEGYSDQG